MQPLLSPFGSFVTIASAKVAKKSRAGGAMGWEAMG